MKKACTYIFFSLLLSIVGVIRAQFIEAPVNLIGTERGAVVWGDYNNDGNMDIFLCGDVNGPPNYSTGSKLYRNDGNNSFIEINTGIVNVGYSSADWGDYDNDGDLDLLITGETNHGTAISVSRIYRNDGSDIFTDINAALTGVSMGSSNWVDIDNDGDLDIFLCGSTPSGVGITRLYINTSTVFVSVATTLPGFTYASSDWGDYDDDGDQDLLIMGIFLNPSGYPTTKSTVFRNDGNLSFTEIGPLPTHVSSGSAKWGDIDNDGDLDLIATGNTGGGGGETSIYRNNGNDLFTNINADITDLLYSSTCWGDFNNDGLLDLHISGESNLARESRVYMNVNNQNFIDIQAQLTGSDWGASSWCDYDNDGDIDLIVTGEPLVTKLYNNTAPSMNTSPSVPDNLSASTDNNWVHFYWSQAYDQQTPSPGIRYILRIGSSPGANDILSPMASAAGHSLKPVFGYVGSSCHWKFKRDDLPNTFYWSVQAVDNAFSRSAFAQEQLFSSVPRIDLVSSSSLQFGDIPIGSSSEWQQVTIKNTSAVQLTVDDFSLHNNPSCFELDIPTTLDPLSPGEIRTIEVRFNPLFVGSIVDTLYISSDAINEPILKVKLLGTGTQVPLMTPSNVSILISGYNAILHWEAVTQTIYGTQIEPDYYLVFFNNLPDPQAPYYYHGCTTGLQYTHGMVGLFNNYSFYRIAAVKFYRYDLNYNELDRLVSDRLIPGLSEFEVQSIIRAISEKQDATQ